MRFHARPCLSLRLPLPSPAAQVVFITTDGFLGEQGKRNEDRLVDNAVRVVRDGANDLAIQLRVKDAGSSSTGCTTREQSPPREQTGEGAWPAETMLTLVANF